MLRLFSDAPPCLDVDVDDLIFFYEIPRKKKGEFKWVFFFLQQFLVINKHVSTNTATGSGTTHTEKERNLRLLTLAGPIKMPRVL